MAYVFMLLFFVCLYGLFRPFKGLKRWHFGIAAFVSFILIGVAAPKTPVRDSDRAGASDKTLSPQAAAALEKKNASKIIALKHEAAALSPTDLDAKLRAYKQLQALAPGNEEFSQKVGLYEGKIASRARYEDHPEEALTIKDFEWGAGGFGAIMIINKLVVTNDAPFAIKDFELKCVHQGHSGTDMDSNTRTVYEIVPANGTKTIRGVNMGFISSQVATSRCEIKSAVSAG